MLYNMFDKFEKYNIPQLDLGVRLPEFKIEDKYFNHFKSNAGK